jgi:hypothetical protein
MIQIQQDTQGLNGIETLISKMGEVSINIDIDSLKSDIDAMELKLSKPFSSKDKKNIKAIRERLLKILSRTEENTLEIIWTVDNELIRAYPFDLVHIPEYNIEMTDYISVGDEHLVRVSYRDVLEIIALDMMYRELGETLQSMEEKLSNIGITVINPSIELTKHFEDNALNLSKILRISDSSYCSADGREIYDYFGQKTFKCDYYRDVVGYSVKRALTIITSSIIRVLNSHGIKYKLCSISESGIYFITDSDEELDKIISESAVVRAFGRKFEVKPKVTVF